VARTVPASAWRLLPRATRPAGICRSVHQDHPGPTNAWNVGVAAVPARLVRLQRPSGTGLHGTPECLALTLSHRGCTAIARAHYSFALPNPVSIKDYCDAAAGGSRGGRRSREDSKQ